MDRLHEWTLSDGRVFSIFAVPVEGNKTKQVAIRIDGDPGLSINGQQLAVTFNFTVYDAATCLKHMQETLDKYLVEKAIALDINNV